MRKKILISFFIALLLFFGFNLFLNIHTLQNQYAENSAKIKNLLMDAHKKNLVSVINGIYSQLVFLDIQAKEKKISLEEAQSLAKKLIKSYQYMENEYVWVNDLEYTLLVHPADHLVGQNVKDWKSAEGRFLFVEIVELCKKNKEGFIPYQASRLGDTKLYPKLSYVKLFEPWKWIVGTGIYIDDVKKQETLLEQELEQKIEETIFINAFFIGGAMLIGFLLVFIQTDFILKPLNMLMRTIQTMQSGNLKVRSPVSSRDEIGKLALAFNKMANTIEDYTQNLEEKVKQRTEELQKALQEVNLLKEKQDGDFFLTALLTKPLMIKDVNTKNIKVEFFLSQYKKFQFKKKNSEIGGDLCIARTTILRNKKYLAFTNADAMGKSIQGAGGVIVMGTVFNSYVSRFHESDLLPEIWLKECFSELQNIFTSFDGSMLISCVTGLLEEESGKVYYFNAEHPWSILYREGKAQFNEQELSIRKIGTIGLDKGFVLQTLQLKTNDILILGTDGRDDIALGIDEKTGQKIVNEDETLFLKCVEEGNGDLKKIVEILTQKGELTDDIGLLKITYLKEETKEKQENYLSLKNQIEEAYQKNEIEKTQKLIEQFLSLYPTEPDILFKNSVVCKKDKNYRPAIDCAEAYRIYYPLDTSNLINLADTYRIIKRKNKALEIIELVEKIEPENSYLIKLKELMEKNT